MLLSIVFVGVFVCLLCRRYVLDKIKLIMLLVYYPKIS